MKEVPCNLDRLALSRLGFSQSLDGLIATATYFLVADLPGLFGLATPVRREVAEVVPILSRFPCLAQFVIGTLEGCRSGIRWTPSSVLCPQILPRPSSSNSNHRPFGVRERHLGIRFAVPAATFLRAAK